YDLVRNAVEREDGTLVVPPTARIVERRNLVLDLLAEDRTPQSGDTYSDADFEAAKEESVVLAPQRAPRWRAPHFVWAVRAELAETLCNEAPTCPELERGGFSITTTLDWEMQRVAERWVQAAATVPQADDPRAEAERLDLPYADWMRNLRGKNLHNGALVAMDYQTGELLAYVGSAGYYRNRLASPEFQPQFDVLADGFRQPGSAFKPFTYVTGIEDRTITAASMFMDVTTDFGEGEREYIPTNADNLERGPVRVRDALRFSLNIPAVKALADIGEQRVFDTAETFGLDFQVDAPQGLSMALGTLEVRPVDLVGAYATLANEGRRTGTTRILRLQDSSGADVVPPYQPPTGQQIVSPQAAHVVTDMLAGNTNPDVNPFWGEFAIGTDGDGRRPFTLKTGTNNDAKDLNAYGYGAPPTTAGREAGEYALVVGAWNGNSDATVVSTPEEPVFSIDVTTYVWEGFIEEVSRGWAVNEFSRPGGLVEVPVDAFSGARATESSLASVPELFLDGTGPLEDDPTKTDLEIEEESGLLWAEGCAGTRTTRAFLTFDETASDHPQWQPFIADWAQRARRGGPGVAGGPEDTRTSYFYNGSHQPYGETWGAPFPPTESCDAAPSPSPSPTASPCPSGITPGPTGDVTVCPTASPSPSPSDSPSPSPSPSDSPSPSPSPSESPSPA
ncbi:MAG: hypothetical protein H0V12_05570, partial [Chloroflexi bacterium]|nr:hypothetical protein [Chloroflexota bacterium]